MSLLYRLMNFLTWVRRGFKAPARKLGHIHSPGTPRPGMLTSYLTDPLTPSPATWMPFYLKFWGMWGNDQYGDCVFAMCANAIKATARYLHKAYHLSDAAVIASYIAYSKAQNNGVFVDGGSIPEQVLQEWTQTSMWGITLPGWAVANYKDPQEVRNIVYNYGVCALSVNLPKPAYTYQMQSSLPTWTITGTPDDDVNEGGHEILAIGSDTNYIYILTWGVIVRVTWAWYARYVIDAEAIITPAVVASGRFAGEPLSKLQTDLSKLQAA